MFKSLAKQVLLALVIVVSAFGQEIHLKTRTLSTPAQNAVNSASASIRNSASGSQTVHQVVEFDHTVGVADLDALMQAGAQVTGVLPDNSVVISMAGGLTAAPDGVIWVGAMEAQDKISPVLGAMPGAKAAAIGTKTPVIVEFHSDIDAAHQGAVETTFGFTFLRPTGLLANHVIVQATAADLALLAAQDEVAYIFPADPAMLTGAGIYSCAGMMTTSGPIAQYSNITHGWDLNSDNIAHLTYFFGSLTSKVPAATVQSEILRAMNDWASNVNVTFSPSAVASATRNIFIEFASGAHGDSYPFDGPGGMLAHTFYPVPVNSEPIAGDMHFDADEPWKVGADTDIYTVALHEIGHALGLTHTDNPGDVMYPYYHRGMALSANDIGAAKELYAPATTVTVVTPVTTPPVTTVTTTVTPTTTTTATTTATSTTTSTATTTATTQAPSAALALTIDPAASSTQLASIEVTGTVTGGTAPYKIQWQTNHGYTGTAVMSGATNMWLGCNIPLVGGANVITVTAYDGADHLASESVTVTMQQAVTTVAAAPIAISIASPVSAVVTTSASTISLSGTASGGAGITQVTWQTSNGATGVASGVGPWVASNIPLPVGTTTIVMRAYDAKGATAWVAMVAVRP